MKIAGVHKSGKNRGDAIELTAEQKVPHALRAGLADHDEQFAISAVNIVVGDTRNRPKGDKFKKKYENSSYTATGSATFAYRNRSTDEVSNPVVKKFKIDFHDRLDSNGLPDITVDKLELF